MKLRTGFYSHIGVPDTSKLKQVTPSYRELPADLPAQQCSGRYVCCMYLRLVEYSVSLVFLARKISLFNTLYGA